MTAACDHNPYPFNFDEIIELSENVLIMVEIVEHPNLRETIRIKQYLKIQGKTSELGSIFIPLNRLSLSALTSLMEFCEEKINAVSSQSILAKFFTQGFDQATAPSAPKQPLSFTITNYSGAEVTPERLQEKITDTSFNLEDIVHAIQAKQPFGQQLKLPLDQIKVLLYYGFIGHRPTITRDVEKELLQMNISYDFKRTGLLLKELAGENMIGMEEKLSRNNRKYFIWAWPSKNDSPLTKSGEKK